MSREQKFAGKTRIIPGAYSEIVSGIKNGFVSLDYGILTIIDTGSNSFYGGGAGINGTITKDKDAIYLLSNLQSAKMHVWGGSLYKLFDYLFFPNGINNPGISQVEIVRAAQTTPASSKVIFTGGGSDGGTFTVELKNEGYVGNGILGDAVRATSVVTISDAGDDTNVFTLSVSGTDIATYAVQTGDAISDIILGLVESLNSQKGDTGFEVKEYDTGNGTITVFAPFNEGASINSTTPSITVSGGGSGAGSAVAFANGSDGSTLTRGYSWRLVPGDLNPDAFIFRIERGTYRGKDTFLSITEQEIEKQEILTEPIIVIDSPEFLKIQDLEEWLNTDSLFNSIARIKPNSFSVAGTGQVTSADLTNFSDPQLFFGGTESFSSQDLDKVLEYLNKSFSSFIFLDKWGEDALDSNNVKIAGWNQLEARFKKELYVASGTYKEDFENGLNSSVSVSNTYDNENLSVVHGGVKTVSSKGLKEWRSVVHAAMLLGREAGIEPQVPLTQKSIGIAGLLHQLSFGTNKEQERAIRNGVLTTVFDEDYDPPRFVCLDGVNSLNNNANILNEDGTSSSKQLRRIVRQINKEIVINAKRSFFANPNGVNRNTVSKGDMEAFVQTYLKSREATEQVDNLIIGFQNINVEVKNGIYYPSYEIIPNFEVRLMFFTGTIIDPSF